MMKPELKNTQVNFSHANDNAKAFNTEASEVLHQVMTGDEPWKHQTPRLTMSDFLDHIRKHKPNPVDYGFVNDN